MEGNMSEGQTMEGQVMEGETSEGHTTDIPDTRGVFLDISKAFDKVWHKGLLHKIKCYGVEGELYNILGNYLLNRKQRVVLNGQSSLWLDIEAGVPQGSVLGPLLFLKKMEQQNKRFSEDSNLLVTISFIMAATR